MTAASRGLKEFDAKYDPHNIFAIGRSTSSVTLGKPGPRSRESSVKNLKKHFETQIASNTAAVAQEALRKTPPLRGSASNIPSLPIKEMKTDSPSAPLTNIQKGEITPQTIEVSPKLAVFQPPFSTGALSAKSLRDLFPIGEKKDKGSPRDMVGLKEKMEQEEIARRNSVSTFNQKVIRRCISDPKIKPFMDNLKATELKFSSLINYRNPKSKLFLDALIQHGNLLKRPLKKIWLFKQQLEAWKRVQKKDKHPAEFVEQLSELIGQLSRLQFNDLYLFLQIIEKCPQPIIRFLADIIGDFEILEELFHIRKAKIYSDYLSQLKGGIGKWVETERNILRDLNNNEDIMRTLVTDGKLLFKKLYVNDIEMEQKYKENKSILSNQYEFFIQLNTALAKAGCHVTAKSNPIHHDAYKLVINRHSEFSLKMKTFLEEPNWKKNDYFNRFFSLNDSLLKCYKTMYSEKIWLPEQAKELFDDLYHCSFALIEPLKEYSSNMSPQAGKVFTRIIAHYRMYLELSTNLEEKMAHFQDHLEMVNSLSKLIPEECLITSDILEHLKRNVIEQWKLFLPLKLISMTTLNPIRLELLPKRWPTLLNNTSKVTLAMKTDTDFGQECKINVLPNGTVIVSRILMGGIFYHLTEEECRKLKIPLQEKEKKVGRLHFTYILKEEKGLPSEGILNLDFVEMLTDELIMQGSLAAEIYESVIKALQ